MLIHWKVIYLVDSAIHPLNTEPAPEKDTEAAWTFNVIKRFKDKKLLTKLTKLQGEVGFERIVRRLHILNLSPLL